MKTIEVREVNDNNSHIAGHRGPVEIYMKVNMGKCEDYTLVPFSMKQKFINHKFATKSNLDYWVHYGDNCHYHRCEPNIPDFFRSRFILWSILISAFLDHSFVWAIRPVHWLSETEEPDL